MKPFEDLPTFLLMNLSPSRNTDNSLNPTVSPHFAFCLETSETLDEHTNASAVAVVIGEPCRCQYSPMSEELRVLVLDHKRHPVTMRGFAQRHHNAEVSELRTKIYGLPSQGSQALNVSGQLLNPLLHLGMLWIGLSIHHILPAR